MGNTLNKEDNIKMFEKVKTRPKPPCRNCSSRKQTANYNCHSHCQAYLEYHATFEEDYKERKIQGMLDDHKAKAMSRYQHEPLKDKERR